jgi:hypothetical protein
LTPSVLVIVGEGNLLAPVAAMTIGNTDDPHAGALVAAIAKRDAGAYGGEVVRLPTHRQLKPVGAVFQSRSTRAAGHYFPCPGDCPVRGSRTAWSFLEEYEVF